MIFPVIPLLNLIVVMKKKYNFINKKGGERDASISIADPQLLRMKEVRVA